MIENDETKKRKLADEQIAVAEKELEMKDEEERVAKAEEERRKIASEAAETNAIVIISEDKQNENDNENGNESGNDNDNDKVEETSKVEIEEQKVDNGIKIGYSHSMVIEDIPIDLIERSSSNVRKLDIESEIISLADSMRDPKIGLEEPIKVRKKGEKYYVYDGQRRVIAAKMLGWKTIPGIVTYDYDNGDDGNKKEYDDIVRSLTHDIEHVHISPQDKADAISILLGQYGNDYRLVAKRLHKPVSTIRTWYSWNSVPEDVKKSVGKHVDKEKRIPRTVAESLSLSLASEEEKLKIARQLSKMRPYERDHAMDVIRDNPMINSEELQEKIGKGSINIHLSFNLRLSDALRDMANDVGSHDYNQIVGDIVVEKLRTKGFLDI